MYHTHWHDDLQLNSGMYGPLIVLEPGQNYDPATERMVLLSQAPFVPLSGPLLINGSVTPAPLQMRVGPRHSSAWWGSNALKTSRRCRAERAGAAGGGRAPVRRWPRSARLRGTRGRGMATPMAPSRTSPRTRAATRGAAGRGAVGAGRTARGSGNLEIWNPGNLRGCGARQVFRFSGFQVFTLPGPAPAGGVAPGRGQLQRHRPREARNWKPEHLEICRR